MQIYNFIKLFHASSFPKGDIKVDIPFSPHLHMTQSCGNLDAVHCTFKCFFCIPMLFCMTPFENEVMDL